MHPQHREVIVENNEYEREQQHLAKQIKCVVILINDHIFAFCAVQKRAHILELFQRNVYACLPSHTFHTSFVAHAWPTTPKAHVMPTNPHVLIQFIHSEYVYTYFRPHNLFVQFFFSLCCIWSCSPGRLLNYMHVHLLMLLRMSIYMAEVARLLVMKIEKVNGDRFQLKFDLLKT